MFIKTVLPWYIVNPTNNRNKMLPNSSIYIKHYDTNKWMSGWISVPENGIENKDLHFRSIMDSVTTKLNICFHAFWSTFYRVCLSLSQCNISMDIDEPPTRSTNYDFVWKGTKVTLQCWICEYSIEIEFPMNVWYQ